MQLYHNAAKYKHLSNYRQCCAAMQGLNHGQPQRHSISGLCLSRLVLCLTWSTCAAYLVSRITVRQDLTIMTPTLLHAESCDTTKGSSPRTAQHRTARNSRQHVRVCHCTAWLARRPTTESWISTGGSNGQYFMIRLLNNRCATYFLAIFALGGLQ